MNTQTQAHFYALDDFAGRNENEKSNLRTSNGTTKIKNVHLIQIEINGRPLMFIELIEYHLLMRLRAGEMTEMWMNRERVGVQCVGWGWMECGQYNDWNDWAQPCAMNWKQCVNKWQGQQSAVLSLNIFIIFIFFGGFHRHHNIRLVDFVFEL